MHLWSVCAHFTVIESLIYGQLVSNVIYIPIYSGVYGLSFKKMHYSAEKQAYFPLRLTEYIRRYPFQKYTFFLHVSACLSVFKATEDKRNVTKMKPRKCSQNKHCFRNSLKMLLEQLILVFVNAVWFIKYKHKSSVYTVTLWEVSQTIWKWLNPQRCANRKKYMCVDIP